MQRVLLTALCCLQLIIYITCTGMYSVIAPGTIRSNDKYNVVVSVHKADEECQMKIGISGPSLNDSQTITVKPMSTQQVEFNIPELTDGDYNLTADGLSGIKFHNSSKLHVDNNNPVILMQTDKAKYKPGDLIQFRVIFLDKHTLPAHIDKPISISIIDGAKNLLKQWKNIELEQGVYSGEYQLSDQPVLDEWEIKVYIEDENVKSKSFEVAKYVLPKFEVSIDTEENVAIAEGGFKVIVRAKYTYGKSVKGKATIKVTPEFVGYMFQQDTLKAEKSIDMDGKGKVDFDFVKDLRYNGEGTYVPPLNVVAEFEDALTGNKQEAKSKIYLHLDRFKIEAVDAPNHFTEEKEIVYTIAVKDVRNIPIQDTKNPVKLMLKPPRPYFFRAIEGHKFSENPEDFKPIEYTSHLNEQGLATFKVTLPKSETNFYSVEGQYLDVSQSLASIHKFEPERESTDLLKIAVNTKKPELGKPISVNIISSEEIPYFVYTLIARGNILHAEYVEVPEKQKVHTIKIMPTFEMVPTVKIYVHYIYGDDLRFEESEINLEKSFENFIDISAEPQAKPGENVTLKVSTDVNSYVGLLGVDQSVLLLKSGNDLSKDDVFNELGNYVTNAPISTYYGKIPGEKSGLVTFTNAKYSVFERNFDVDYLEAVPFEFEQLDSIDRFDADSETSQTLLSRTIQIRKNFEESWIWYNNKNSNGNSSDFSISKQIPDTITSWVITGFSISPKKGIALTENPTKIKVFQPFFVSTNLPYSVKRGEIIAIPIIVYNYMEKALDAEITLNNEDKEYEFVEITNEVQEKYSDEEKQMKRLTVPANTGQSVSFLIKPIKIGDISLKVDAMTPLAGDRIHKTLKVEPEGTTQYGNKAFFITLDEESEQEKMLTVDMPEEIVPDSEYIEFSVMGDILGPTIQNLDKLVLMPYGCGEQNMVNFVPNILVVDYLKSLNKNMPKIVERARKFMEVGYQRELTYKHDDGSYSAFGKSDKSGSTWLTAYVIRSFHQAAKFIDIEPKIIMQGLDFLSSKQAENGSFAEHGKVIDFAHQDNLALNSFVLLAFLENEEYLPKYEKQVKKGLKYIMEESSKSDDLYSLSIAALAARQSNSSDADKVFEKLKKYEKFENGLQWWRSKPNTENKYFTNSNKDIEITSYILLNLLSSNDISKTIPIVKWLISKRNSFGGFASTQDTVMGLQALIGFAKKTGSGSSDINVDLTTDESNASFNINNDNSLVLQSHILSKTTRNANFTVKGKGVCLVQLSYNYNIIQKDENPSFKVAVDVEAKNDTEQLLLNVSTTYIPKEATELLKSSNMAVLEVNLPSGYTIEKDELDALVDTFDIVKRTESENDDSKAIIYFESLEPNQKIVIPLKASKTHNVSKQKPAEVTVYDYYDTARRVTEYYAFPSSLCEVCKNDVCPEVCPE